MIVLDTDVLSYFSRLDRLPLLLALFSAPVGVSPNVQRELQDGLRLGYQELLPALAAIQTGAIHVLMMDQVSQAHLSQVGLASDKGEADALAYCLAVNAVFVTNDMRAYRHACRLGVQCLRLPALLRLLWKREVLDSAGVKALIVEMETRLGIVVLDQSEIFSDASD